MALLVCLVCVCVYMRVYMCLRVSVCVGVYVLFQVHRTSEVSLWHSTQDIHYAAFLFVCMHARTTRSVRDEYVYLSDMCGLQCGEAISGHFRFILVPKSDKKSVFWTSKSDFLYTFGDCVEFDGHCGFILDPKAIQNRSKISSKSM